MTLKYLINYLAGLKHDSGNIVDSTYLRYQDCLKSLSSFGIADKEIKNITSEDLRNYLNSLREKSSSEIHKHYTLLKKIYRYAFNKGYIPVDLMSNKDEMFKPVSLQESKPVLSLNLFEQKKLVRVLSVDERLNLYSNILLLLLISGMRVGEVLSLRRSDIDWSTKVIHVRRTMTKDVNNKYVIGHKTKTYTSVRDVSITLPIESVLRDVLLHSPENPENLLFWNRRADTFFTPYGVYSYCERLNQNYHIAPKLHPHMLRHSYATRCIESGMSPVVLQHKLGHKSVMVTLNTYATVFRQFESEKDSDLIRYLAQNDLL